MAANSKIEWTESTWNPVTGCTKISPGCKNCYAERLALRLQAARNPSYVNGFKVTLHERMVLLPLKWKKPRFIFVNSMSDLFHDDVPDEFIFLLFNIMNKAHWHRFQILTKRSDRLMKLDPKLKWSENIWMGVSVEDIQHAFRVNELRATSAEVKFLSLEPLLDSMQEIDLSGIDWVVVGGESGPKARPIDYQWVVALRDRCKYQNVPFFFKQWGGTNKRKAGRQLDGRTWEEMPKSSSIGSVCTRSVSSLI
jgi:protein gp37